MSWSINKTFRNVVHATNMIEAARDLPESIRQYILTGLAGIARKDEPVIIEGSGHLCYEGAGGGNYQETSATLKVKPLEFSP